MTTPLFAHDTTDGYSDNDLRLLNDVADDLLPLVESPDWRKSVADALLNLYVPGTTREELRRGVERRLGV